MNRNLKKALFALFILVAYLWDQDRRSYVIYPELGVAISTQCHIKHVHSLNTCEGETVKIKLLKSFEGSSADLTIYYMSDDYYQVSTVKLNKYWAKVVVIPENTSSVQLSQ